MKLKDFAAGTVDWSGVPESTHPGITGIAVARSHQLGDIQLRLVGYSPGYAADHWCHKGHIVFVVAGQIAIEHEGGTRYPLTTGMTYFIADGDGPPHRVVSENGATVFVVD